MRHLMVSAPIAAVAFTLAALVAGFPVWVVICVMFFSAPAFVGMAYLICNTVYPCDTALKQDDNESTRGRS